MGGGMSVGAKLPYILLAISYLLAAMGGAPLRAEDEDLADVVAAVVQPRGTTILAGHTAIADDDLIIRAGNTYVTKDDVIIKAGSTYVSSRGIVIRAGNTFVGDQDITIKAGSTYVGDRGLTLKAGSTLIGPDE